MVLLYAKWRLASTHQKFLNLSKFSPSSLEDFSKTG
ncbi:hypothetical protein RUMGNA_01959 [Mediterraneibacter gnavus ATCC 29149]|uniref:Uncharacterized protein n=1 Tax=Mediterraneibacter gnavus (strain ATCC 29149 / DSM 114966 / JCM 6515 / VPI C7-9) TaxID=411470 RepID=A7B331_MEDG7|nr:hypothetical protein RUMGNA_01959 [Mediterraneibacter gnavus ATCC 29149]